MKELDRIESLLKDAFIDELRLKRTHELVYIEGIGLVWVKKSTPVLDRDKIRDLAEQDSKKDSREVT